MPDPKTDDIIDLTDIIEYGARASKPEKAAEGVDLNFERELEGLFAESSPHGAAPAHAPAAAPRGADPAIEALRQHFGERIDAVAAKVEALPAPVDPAPLMERLAKDLRSELSTLKSQGAAHDPAAVEARMLALVEDRLRVFQAGQPPVPAALDENALADRIKREVFAQLPNHVEIPAPVDPTPLVQELTKGLRFEVEALKGRVGACDPAAVEARLLPRVEERLQSFQTALPAIPSPVNELFLIDRVKREVFAELADHVKNPAPADPAPLVENLTKDLRSELSALKAATSVQNPAAMEARIFDRVEERLQSFQAALPAIPAPVNELFLVDRVKREVFAELADHVKIPAPVDPAPLVENMVKGLRSELSALKDRMAAQDPAVVEARILTRMEDRLKAHQAGLPPIPAPADEKAIAARVRGDILADQTRQQAKVATMEGLTEQLKVRLAALEAKVHATPALPEGLATQKDIDGLRREMLDEIRRAVPQAAARIVREEIQGLLKELG